MLHKLHGFTFLKTICARKYVTKHLLGQCRQVKVRFIIVVCIVKGFKLKALGNSVIVPGDPHHFELYLYQCLTRTISYR